MGKNWDKVDFFDLEVGDVVKVQRKTEDSEIRFEGNVTSIDLEDNSFRIGDEGSTFGKWIYKEELEEVGGATLSRKVPPFVWPNKLGAVVSYESDDKTYYVTLVAVDNEDPADPYPNWYHPLYGICNRADMEGYKKLRVISPGVDTGPEEVITKSE